MMVPSDHHFRCDLTATAKRTAQRRSGAAAQRSLPCKGIFDAVKAGDELFVDFLEAVIAVVDEDVLEHGRIDTAALYAVVHFQQARGHRRGPHVSARYAAQ